MYPLKLLPTTWLNKRKKKIAQPCTVGESNPVPPAVFLDLYVFLNMYRVRDGGVFRTPPVHTPTHSDSHLICMMSGGRQMDANRLYTTGKEIILPSQSGISYGWFSPQLRLRAR
jgi:hypothetical protein